MLNQKLQQRLLQKLSPQQVLVMRLVQEPILSLEQRIKQELEENPALEEATGMEDEVDGEDERLRLSSTGADRTTTTDFSCFALSDNDKSSSKSEGTDGSSTAEVRW